MPTPASTAAEMPPARIPVLTPDVVVAEGLAAADTEAAAPAWLTVLVCITYWVVPSIA
jgi:hypothetical protein